MPFARFLPVSAAAALAWAAMNSLEYYWFGRALAGADTWVQVLLVAVGVVWLMFSSAAAARPSATAAGVAAETEASPSMGSETNV